MDDCKIDMVSGLVSVIIPTYKRPTMLGRAIDSVLNQSYTNIEVVVVDDNSNGDMFRMETIQYMEKYINDYRVKYIKHERNQNGSAARNTGIQNSVGEYIAFLDDDDYFLKNRIKDAMCVLQHSDMDCGGICCNYVKKYKNKIYKVSRNKGRFDSCYELLAAQVDYAAGSTLIIKREILGKVGMFDTSFQRHQDWEFLIRLFRHYYIGIVSNIGVVICADGIRNTPHTDKLLTIKNKLLQTFIADIKQLEVGKQVEIYQAQWKEIIYSYLKERKYSKAVSFARRKKVWSSLRMGDVPNIILSSIIGIVPSFMIIVYSICNLRFCEIRENLYK
ncbi:glycosyltransferase family 2 protein [uncultured Bacteroides sp.]|uniref:glycosyltransferase family 2 protein n=1 Tax=uncultured Bacteroides sp. TaxID=162156 RepID=UPI002624A058|nr:glycosyltransferase family 2 protein [uncultured Bacteroides sp.]